MQYVVVIVAVAPMRKEPSHKAEMVSQMLFGEKANVLETTADFSLVQCEYDNYEGWVQTSQINIHEDVNQLDFIGYSFKRNAPLTIGNSQMHISVGTPVYTNLVINQHPVQFAEEYLIENGQMLFEPYLIKTVALLFENVPYLWGGKSSFGIDCSGFTQQVFKLFNKMLPRNAYQQATCGEAVNFENIQCGDLAFFANENNHVTHVGLVLANNEIIHASGFVRVDTLTTYGIINKHSGAQTHALHSIRRI